MPPVIIADASCLILLEKIGALDLLRQLYGRVLVTNVVAGEYGLPLPDWISVQPARDERQVQLLSLTLYQGEASAIALALEQADCLLIMDEQRGRNVARQLQLTVTGTLGVLLDAKQSGYVSAIRPLVERISTTNFRLSEALVQAILRQAGE